MDVKRNKSTAQKNAALLKAREIAAKYGGAVLSAVGGFVLAPCELFFGIFPFGLALAAAVTSARSACAAAVAAMFSTALSARSNKFALCYIASYALLFGARFLIGRVKPSRASDPEAEADDVRANRKLTALLASAWDKLASAMPDSPFYESVMLRSVLSGAAALFVFALTLFGSFSRNYLFAAVFATLITPAITYAYAGVADTKLRFAGSYGIGRAILLLSLVIAFRGVSFFGIGLSSVLAYAASLAVSHYYGAAKGAVTGLLCGIAISPLYSPAYAIGPLVAGVLWKLSSVSAVSVAGIASLSWVVYSGGMTAVAAIAPDVAVACLIAVPVARFRLLAPKYEAKTDDSSYPEAAVKAAEMQRAASRDRIRDMTDGMASVASVFKSLSEKMKRPSVMELREICNTASRKRCESCASHDICWDSDLGIASGMLDKMTVSLHDFGRISADDVPPRIAARCVGISDMIDEMNSACASLTREMSREDKSGILGVNFLAVSDMLRDYSDRQTADFAPDPMLAERISKSIARGGLYAESVAVYGEKRKKIFVGGLDLRETHLGNDDIRELLEEIVGMPLATPEYTISGDRVSMLVSSAPAVEAVFGRYTQSGSEDETNGDSAVCFANKDGMFYSLISDGMGSGREAALTSRVSAAFTERMLGAGCSMKDALGMLNNFIRAGTLECSATIDLMELDLYSGEAKFVKSGAAPSFVLRDGKIFRLQSKTAPIGILRALDAEMINLKLKDGDLVVMLSDGVISGFDDSAWLLDLFSENGARFGDPAKAAKMIARRAREEASRPDDVTVTVIKIRGAR